MILLVPCGECVKAEQSDSTKRPAIVFHRGRLEDAGFVRLKCNKGHETTVMWDQRKHETLLRSACEALLDGYEREAVSSFAAALERAFEFFIRVTWTHLKVTADVVEKSWKLMAKQSERQFGAFVSQHALIASTPPAIDQKMVEFRNKVIHQGYIPGGGETLAFGEYVFNVHRDMLHLLKSKCADALDLEHSRESAEIAKAAPSGIPVIKFKAFLVNVRSGTNEATEITQFSEFLKGIRENRLT